MRLERFIAKRYLASTRHSSSVNLLKWIGIAGVALGVCSLVVVVSVMRGFEKDFEEKIIGFQAPVILEVPADQMHEANDILPRLEDLMSKHSTISSGQHRIEGELVIETEFGTTTGGRVRGVDRPFEELPGVETFELVENKSDLPGIVLGSEMAAALQVHPDFEDEVRLVFPFGDISPSGAILPRVRKFRVVGVFHSGFYEYDSRFALIETVMAERLFGEYARSSLALSLHDPADSEALRAALLAEYPGHRWTVSTWRKRNQRLFQALLLERVGMIVLLLMIVLIASFGIFALLSMIVLEKIPDMAIMRSLGMRAAQIRRIFLWQAGTIGLRGTLIGGTAGLVIAIGLTLFPYRLPASYYIDTLPVALEPITILMMILLGPVISLLAGLYPAWQSTRYGIANVLRYE